ncbi:diguanylate cyclase (GGDEF) domain-containing protein [Thiohalospira halophila DSM 15071]|uniref:diguanylate cyclase n=1 Tax=Thiohalospira halophila DSM 15071 TaxID=1123397 RepID=A0A1I1QTW2_9GAMM|nr:GGDEF domain-containing protein [Thiohalospira halophila]SFD25437.1 diguanylate cyclase (GGDEF) domain-containing protein [Thiohalospira halophila DSM 15071]
MQRIHPREWLRYGSLADLFTARNHSPDFNGARAERIALRIEVLSLVAGLLTLAWIPLDLLFLAEPGRTGIVSLRVGAGLAFLLLAGWRHRRHDLFRARLRLALFILIPAAFYVGARLVLAADDSDTGIVVGYYFLPYLMVTILAIFPLTLVEGIAGVAAVGATLALAEVEAGAITELTTLAEFWLLALLAAIVVWVQQSQLYMLLRLYREATRDALTGLFNRRALLAEMERARLDCRRTGEPLSVLLFDLDLFKRINDTHGHLTGDAVLADFAGVLRGVCQRECLLSRYGGEEFLVALPGRDAGAARVLAETIRAETRGREVRAEDGTPVSYTVSVGVAQGGEEEAVGALLSRVDQALYQAKEGGRDLVAEATVDG